MNIRNSLTSKMRSIPFMIIEFIKYITMFIFAALVIVITGAVSALGSASETSKKTKEQKEHEKVTRREVRKQQRRLYKDQREVHGGWLRM
jgi:hypothetical protein